jgi:hypothetical protein
MSYQPTPSESLHRTVCIDRWNNLIRIQRQDTPQPVEVPLVRLLSKRCATLEQADQLVGKLQGFLTTLDRSVMADEWFHAREHDLALLRALFQAANAPYVITVLAWLTTKYPYLQAQLEAGAYSAVYAFVQRWNVPVVQQHALIELGFDSLTEAEASASTVRPPAATG